jgi:uncharacterized protein (TIGR02145 family)
MERRAFVSSILAVSAGFLVSCGKSSTTPTETPDPATPTDADGHVYRTVQIGNQFWMAENLRTTRGVGGGALPGAYAYGDLESNVATYGRLYTWNTATMPIITGWHLPSYGEWTTLINMVGAENAGALLRQGGSSGFNAVFGGYRDYGGGYRELEVWSAYWTSTVMNVVPADHSHLVNIWKDQPQVDRTGAGMIGGHSVRLVRDN